MVIFISQIPYEKFKALPDKKEYALACDYISIKVGIKKSDFYNTAYGWAEWYNLFSITPIYLYLISESEWFSSVKEDGLKNHLKFTNWKYIPRNSKEAESYMIVREEDRLWKDESFLSDICNQITNKNISKTKYIGCILKQS